jgi:hypothetical protein
MRTLAKWILLGGFAAFLVVAIAPMARADDAIAIFHVPVPMLMGQVVLDPGVYEFRALQNSPDRRLIRIAKAGETSAAAYIMASVRQPLVGEIPDNTNYLFLKGSEPSRLMKWDVSGLAVSYLFTTIEKAPPLTAEAQTPVIVLRASR